MTEQQYSGVTLDDAEFGVGKQREKEGDSVNPAPKKMRMTEVEDDNSVDGKEESLEANLASLLARPRAALQKAQGHKHGASPDEDRRTQARRQATLEFLRQNYRIVPAPPLSCDAAAEFADSSPLFGHHVKKDRGCAQDDLLKLMEEDEDTQIGEYLREQRQWAGAVGTVVNRFASVNGGEKTNNGDEENGLAHKDKLTRKGKLKATLRIICYYMTDGKEGTLRVWVDGFEFDIVVPRGCALVATDKLLENHYHAHGALFVEMVGRAALPTAPPGGPWQLSGHRPRPPRSKSTGACGRSISIVTEVQGTLPAPATPHAIEAAGKKQPSLRLLELFGVWNPADMFFGEKLRCLGELGGSLWNLAVTNLAGPKVPGQRRNMKAAREQLQKMSEKQIRQLAQKQAFGGQGVDPEKQRERANKQMVMIQSQDGAKKLHPHNELIPSGWSAISGPAKATSFGDKTSGGIMSSSLQMRTAGDQLREELLQSISLDALQPRTDGKYEIQCVLCKKTGTRKKGQWQCNCPGRGQMIHVRCGLPGQQCQC